MRASSTLTLSALSLLLAMSCADCGGVEGEGDDRTDGGTLGTDQTSDGGRSRDGGGTGTPGNDGGQFANNEVCDGIDNDGNGVIDDVDTAGDGVCDCLKIATLGFRGQWGSGNVFQNWLDGKSVAGAVSLEDQTLTPERLSQFDVIVAQDVRSESSTGVGSGIGRQYSEAEVQALEAWVRAGGGFMTLIGYAGPTEITNVNRLLAPFGMAYGSQQILPKSGSVTVPVTNWATHPLTQSVTRVGVDNGYPVSGGTLIAWEPQPGNHDVARATTAGTGHVYVWGDEWITYDSEWTANASYQVERFWLNALKWLTAEGRCQVALPGIN